MIRLKEKDNELGSAHSFDSPSYLQTLKSYSKEIWLNSTESLSQVMVLLQQDLRKETPMMLVNATAYSLLKSGLSHC